MAPKTLPSFLLLCPAQLGGGLTTDSLSHTRMNTPRGKKQNKKQNNLHISTIYTQIKVIHKYNFTQMSNQTYSVIKDKLLLMVMLLKRHTLHHITQF